MKIEKLYDAREKALKRIEAKKYLVLKAEAKRDAIDLKIQAHAEKEFARFKKNGHKWKASAGPVVEDPLEKNIQKRISIQSLVSGKAYQFNGSYYSIDLSGVFNPIRLHDLPPFNPTSQIELRNFTPPEKENHELDHLFLRYLENKAYFGAWHRNSYEIPITIAVNSDNVFYIMNGDVLLDKIKLWCDDRPWVSVGNEYLVLENK